MMAEVKSEVSEAEVKTEVSEAEEDGRTLEQIEVKTEVKTEIKIEVDVAEEDWRTLDQYGQDSTHDWRESNATDAHHETDTQPLVDVNTKCEPVTEPDTCQWIKTESVEENKRSDVFRQFQSEPVDKSERKGDIKRESLTGMGLSCGQMSSGSTGSFEQSQFRSNNSLSKVKRETCTCSESNIMNLSSVIKTEAVVSSKDFKVTRTNTSNSMIKTDPLATCSKRGIKIEPDRREMSSGTTGSFDQSQLTSSKVKLKPFTNSELDTSRNAEPAYSSDSHVDVEIENDYATDPDEAVTRFSNIIRQPDNYLQTEEATNIKMTVTSIEEDKDKSSGDEQEYNESCPTGHQDPGSNKPTTSVTTTLRPFVCEKGFTQKAYLKKHKVIHTGRKSFVCDVCNVSFALKRNLKQHKLIHAGQKPDACEKDLLQKCNLKTHKSFHTGQKSFVCDVCEKGFTLKGDLKKHKLIHTGQKPFVCDVCEKAFTLKHNLKTHKLLHAGQKPFVCDVCEKAFPCIGYLTKHKRIHSGHKPFCVMYVRKVSL